MAESKPIKHPKITLGVFVRSLVFQILFVILVIGMSLVILISSLFSTTPSSGLRLLVSKLALYAVRLVGVICGTRYRLTGYEHFQEVAGQRLVVACNHQSTMETGLTKFLFHPCIEIMKQELIKVPLFGRVLKATQPIIIDRSDPQKARQKLITDGIKALDEGLIFIAFAEGTRKHGLRVGKYKTGCFQLAIEAEAKVLPVVHNCGQFWPAKGFFKFPGIAEMIIGEAIDSKGFNPRELANKVENWARQNYPNSSNG